MNIENEEASWVMLQIVAVTLAIYNLYTARGVIYDRNTFSTSQKTLEDIIYSL